MTLYKKGDIVRLLPSSPFYNQCLNNRGKPTRGTILRIHSPVVTSYYYEIKWKNGRIDGYRPIDIKLIREGKVYKSIDELKKDFYEDRGK